MIEALKVAQKMGLKTASMTGGSGGEVARLSNFNLNVALGKNAPRTQETHLVILHSLAQLVDQILFP